MTTNHTELCERLRSTVIGWEGAFYAAKEAADLIESQAARIAELEKERDAAEKHAAAVSRENFDLEARIAELEKGLKGLSSMYTFAWDVVDGGLFMSQDGKLRFEDAHKEARRVLGVELMEVDENGELTPEHEERTKLAARIAELEKERDALKADISREQEVRFHERERHNAKLDRCVAILTRIHSFMTPEDVRLPDGRVMRFSNPEIEREMLRGLCEAIRCVPYQLDAALQAEKETRS